MISRRVVLLVPVVAFGDESQDWNNWLGDWAARLTEESPGEFLERFAPELRGRLGANVRALVAAAQVSSSITLLGFEGEGDGRTLTLDWVMELRFRALATGNEQRREQVRLTLARYKRDWRVTGFTPEGLLAGPRG